MSSPLQEYMILTSKESKTILATLDTTEAYDFIRKHPDTRFRLMDYTAKPSVISKEKFLERFYKLTEKKTEDQARLFELVDILFPHYSHASAFLAKLTLLEQYKKYKKITDNHL